LEDYLSINYIVARETPAFPTDRRGRIGKLGEPSYSQGIRVSPIDYLFQP